MYPSVALAEAQCARAPVGAVFCCVAPLSGRTDVRTELMQSGLVAHLRGDVTRIFDIPLTHVVDNTKDVTETPTKHCTTTTYYSSTRSRSQARTERLQTYHAVALHKGGRVFCLDFPQVPAIASCGSIHRSAQTQGRVFSPRGQPFLPCL